MTRLRDHILFSAPMIRAILDGRKTQTRRVMLPQPQHLQRHEWRGQLVYDGEHRLWCWREHTYDNIWDFPDNDERRHLAKLCPYGAPGDRLWVRETWQILRLSIQPMTGVIYNAVPFVEIPKAAPVGEDWELDYRADGEDPDPANAFPWRPGIYMPRWASRITLEITDVRVQRLQEITEDDARAESVNELTAKVPAARDAFRLLWDDINGKPRPMLDDDGEPVLDDDGRPHMVASRSWASNPWVWAISFRRLP